jgi:hypothetical protein
MTFVLPPGRPGVSPEAPDHTRQLRDIARKINEMNRGWLNCTIQVTLTANAASTTIKDARISLLNTAVLMCPTTAHAAAEIAAGTLYFTITDGQVVINHANNAQADRTFQMALIG